MYYDIGPRGNERSSLQSIQSGEDYVVFSNELDKSVTNIDNAALALAA